MLGNSFVLQFADNEFLLGGSVLYFHILKFTFNLYILMTLLYKIIYISPCHALMVSQKFTFLLKGYSQLKL